MFNFDYNRIDAAERAYLMSKKTIANDYYWLSVADNIAEKSRCFKRRCGAVILDKHGRVIATGYNGHPRGTDKDNSCLRLEINSGESNDIGYCCHAEMNAMIFANYNDMQGGVLYLTHPPCLHCMRYILQSGIGELVYYSDEKERSNGLELLNQLNTPLTVRGRDRCAAK